MLDKQCLINNKRKRIGIAIVQTRALLYVPEQVRLVGLNHNVELLLTQIFCRRLNLGRGIVSLEVGLSYDLLRFIPRPTICNTLKKTLKTSSSTSISLFGELCWGKEVFGVGKTWKKIYYLIKVFLIQII